MSGKRLYLDTTAGADRIFGLPETRQALKEVCHDHVLLSSVYVWDEFRRTFIGVAVLCHTMLLNSMVKGESLRDGLQRVRQELNFKPRRKDRAWDILAYMQDPPIRSLENAVDRLEKNIRFTFRRLFFRGLQLPLQDTVHCRMTDESPTIIPPDGPSGYTRFEMRSGCSKDAPRDCGIVTFWENNVEALRLVAAMAIPTGASKATRKELSQVRDEARKIATAIDGRVTESYGETCYVHLGDLVITLECPRDVPIVTSNVRHFAPLTYALSRPKPISYR